MSGSNLNEWETKVSVLERNNFDLKMQVYYLNEKMANNLSDSKGGSDGEEDEFHEYEYGKRSSEMLTLTEENSQFKRRVVELESELLQLKLQQQKESARYEAALRAQPASMEEAQKREREAAFAIAEHDAILIHKLEIEVGQLAKGQQHDKLIIQQLADELHTKNELLKDKTLLLTDLTTSTEQMRATNASLLDQVRQFEVARITSTADSGEFKDREIRFLQSENDFLKEELDRHHAATKSSEEAMKNFQQFLVSKEALSEQLAHDLRKALEEREALQKKCHALHLQTQFQTQQSESRKIEIVGKVESAEGGATREEVERYKAREAELMTALEGVVRKYKELEARTRKGGARP